ncbi:MAG TPA: hypothetical protein VLN47_00440 [Clostridiaceae bacterium]|nr:hypothetical protein [Clostridiaceae bacterium]
MESLKRYRALKVLAVLIMAMILPAWVAGPLGLRDETAALISLFIFLLTVLFLTIMLFIFLRSLVFMESVPRNSLLIRFLIGLTLFFVFTFLFDRYIFTLNDLFPFWTLLPKTP